MNFDPANRPALKEHAKESIRQAKAHGIPITLVTIVYVVMQLAPSLISQLQVTRLQRELMPMILSGTLDNLSDLQALQLMQSYMPSPSYSVVTLLLGIFLSIVAVGYQKYCLHISRHQHPGELSALFDGFKQFGRFFGILFLTGLFAALWYLAGIIVGGILTALSAVLHVGFLSFLGIGCIIAGGVLSIIAVLRYSQAIYAAIDDPNLSAMDAIRTSKALMQGHKGQYFVLGLSFLGWSLLVALTMGILGIYTEPYMNTTYASFYNGLIGWQPAAEGESTEPQPVLQDKEPEWWEK